MARFASQPSKCKHRAHYHCRANDVLRLNICPTLSGHKKQHWWRTSIIRPVARLSGVLALRIRHVALAQILKNKQLAVRIRRP